MTSRHSWPEVLTGLVHGRDLDADQTAWAMEEILSGQASNAQIAGFAVALRAKGETVAELEGLVSSMYAHAEPLTVPGRVVDIVGTGGDRSRTVNISSMSAVVMAGAGALVVKHGNRAASSASGSADVLEALGVRLDVPVHALAAVAEGGRGGVRRIAGAAAPGVVDRPAPAPARAVPAGRGTGRLAA